jgi:hypothetical protein
MAFFTFSVQFFFFSGLVGCIVSNTHSNPDSDFLVVCIRIQIKGFMIKNPKILQLIKKFNFFWKDWKIFNS